MKLAMPQLFIDMEKTATETIEYILSFNSPTYIVLNVFLMCIIPALGEELFFRGIIQRILSEWTKKNWVSILITAFIFSAIHFQFLTFLPRFFMGIMLGYVFVWSQNILVPIIVHFLHNFFSILIALFTTDLEITEPQQINITLVIIATLVMTTIGYWYYSESKKRYVS